MIASLTRQYSVSYLADGIWFQIPPQTPQNIVAHKAATESSVIEAFSRVPDPFPWGR